MNLFDWILATLVGFELTEEAATAVETEVFNTNIENNSIFIDEGVDIHNSEVYIDPELTNTEGFYYE